MSKLPDSWAECLIGDVTRIVAGGTPPSKETSNFTTGDTGVPWITPADLSGYQQIYISRGARNLTEKGFSECSAIKMPTGSVLFSSRAPIGYVVIAANEVSTNQGFKSFVLPDGLNNHFIYYYLKYIKPVAEEMATGTTFKELSGATTAKVPLIVAPSNEQKRIADKLDALLARVDTCRERLDRVPLILKRFRQSVLAAATSGKLTEEWRAEKGACYDNLIEIPLDEACIKITDGEHIGPALTTSGIPLVSAKDVREWGVDFSDTKFVSAEFSSFSRRRCNPELDDVLVVSRGATVGRACLITSDREFCLMGSVLLFKPAVDIVNPRYLAAFLRSPLGLQRLTGASGASAQSAIYIRDTKKLLISLPPKEEQTEIVCRVETLFAYADRLEARYSAARAQVEKLTPALLAKAFRGELVPQDPNDEPASALLQRIRAARAEQPKTTRARKPPATMVSL